MLGFYGRLRDAIGRLWAVLLPPTVPATGEAGWSEHEARCHRYDILWSFYDQSVYTGRHGQEVLRETRSYKLTKSIYNSCGRIVEFHATHLMGGLLDPDAGDGKEKPSCLPIVPGESADPAIAAAVASLWKASNWQVKKTIYTRWGAALGDVGLEVIPDLRRGLMRLRVIHPAEFEDITLDDYGNVKAGALCRRELDPEDPKGTRYADYRETFENDGGKVVYRTYRNNRPYEWPGTAGAEWKAPWGFIPIVLAKHIDQGGTWGVSEIQNALVKTIERDAQGTNLGHQAEKLVNSPWFLTGAALPAAPLRAATPWDGDPLTPAEYRIAPSNLTISVDERSGIPIVTCNATDARMTPLVAPLPIGEVSAHIDTIRDALESDYPELQAENVGLAASGEARRVARQKAEAKVIERRTGYDKPLVSAQMMAMTMGGMLGFEDYPFRESDFDAGRLDHHIGPRPVFGADPMETLQEHQARATAVGAFVTAGVPLADALVMTGIDPDDAAEIAANKDAEADKAMERQRKAAADQFADEMPLGDGDGGEIPAGTGANGKANGDGFSL